MSDHHFKEIISLTLGTNSKQRVKRKCAVVVACVSVSVFHPSKAQLFFSSQQNLREPLFHSRGCVPIHVTLCTHSRWCVPSMLHFMFTKEGMYPHMSHFAPVVEVVCHPCHTLHIIQRAWGIP